VGILKHEIKGGPQYVVFALFSEKIIEGKIGTANPQFFANAKRFDL
jgi:hypothetical protein